jgi:hypothetical protein
LTSIATPAYLVLLGFNVEGDDASKAVELVAQAAPNETVRVGVYETFFARSNREYDDASPSEPPKFMAMLEFNEPVDISPLSSGISVVEIAEFKLAKAFGEEVPFYA